MVSLTGQHARRGYVVDAGTNVCIGRARNVDIVLDDARVSRLHAEVCVDGCWLRVTDLGSSNGIELDGAKTKTALLSDGDVFQIGPYTFEVSESDAAATAVLYMHTGTAHIVCVDVDSTSDREALV